MPSAIVLKKRRPTLRHVDAEKKFDLNIQDVLEDWGVPQALREVIANALDEQALTGTRNIEIVKGKVGRWHIRDYAAGVAREVSIARLAVNPR